MTALFIAMSIIFQNPVYATMCAAFLTMLIVDLINTRFFMSPKLFLLKRWLRCVFFTCVFGAILSAILPNRGMAQMLLCGFLIYALGETVLYWIIINASSISPYARIHPYEAVETAWRPEKKLLDLKRKILESGFKQSASMISKMEEEPLIYQTSFDSADSKIRLTVAFIGYAGGWITASSAYSVGDDGRVIYTEALSLPFGLEYPENFDAARFPLLEDPLKLLKKHENRISKSKLNFVDINSNPIESATAIFVKTEEKNRQDGFLTGDLGNEDYFTRDGKCRIWKDMILVNYLPFLIK